MCVCVCVCVCVCARRSFEPTHSSVYSTEFIDLYALVDSVAFLRALNLLRPRRKKPHHHHQQQKHTSFIASTDPGRSFYLRISSSVFSGEKLGVGGGGSAGRAALRRLGKCTHRLIHPTHKRLALTVLVIQRQRYVASTSVPITMQRQGRKAG